MQKLIYRIMDANFNRAREGLRVCEEFVRFIANDRALTREFKNMRNQVGRAYKNFAGGNKALFINRDSIKDAGRKSFSFEKKRKKLIDVFWANMQRSKEALRVLEEFSKLTDENSSDRFRGLRFKAYDVEKKAFKKLKGLIY